MRLPSRSRRKNRSKLALRVKSKLEPGPRLLRGPPPRTMILLDPDLDPYPAEKTGKRVPASGRWVSRPDSAAKSQPDSAQRPQPVPSSRVLAHFLARAQAAVRLRGHVTVLLTTDPAIRKLNRQFRGIDKATDVLSFLPADFVQGQKNIAGDLAISLPTARRQSTACGHSLAIELKVLILHGLLHLAGYDHESDSGQMDRRERVLRARLGLPQGLIERAQKTAPQSRNRRNIRPTAGGAR